MRLPLLASFASAASMVGPATPAFFAASIAGCSFAGSASWNGHGIAAVSALSAAAFSAAAWGPRLGVGAKVGARGRRRWRWRSMHTGAVLARAHTLIQRACCRLLLTMPIRTRADLRYDGGGVLE